MSKRVYRLKHATPRMKYLHMKDMMEFNANLKQHQAEYQGEGDCPRCNNPMGPRPLFMVGQYDFCYSCLERDNAQRAEDQALAHIDELAGGERATISQMIDAVELFEDMDKSEAA